MPTIARTSRPACPACGFPVFNRRCVRCEKCQAELPPSIAYTPAEIATMRQNEAVEDDKRARRLAKAKAERIARTGLRSEPSGLTDAVDLGLDLGDLLGGGN